MHQRIKTTTHGIVELGKQKQDSDDISLFGTKNLAKHDIFVKSAFDNNSVDLSKSHFYQSFSSDDEFMYIVQMNGPDYKTILAEVGIASISKDHNTLFRKRPLYTISSSGKFSPVTNGPTKFYSDTDGTYLIIKNYVPVNLSEFFIQPNSVIVCGEQEFTPFPAYIEENSLLGRKEGLIESLPISETVNESIKSYTKQLILKSSQLDVRKIKTKQLLLSPHDAPDAKTGTIFYNKSSNCLQYYDGHKWKTLLDK